MVQQVMPDDNGPFAPTAAPQPQPQAQPTFSTAAPNVGTSGSTLSSLFGAYGQNPAYGADHDTFLAKLIEMLKSTSIEVIRMALPTGTHLFKQGNYAVALYFPALQSVIRAGELKPASDWGAVVEDTIRKERPDVALIASYEVMPHDLERVQQWAMIISDQLRSRNDPAITGLTAAALAQDGSQYVYTPSVEEARRIFQANWPHGVMPAGELGLVLRLRKDNKGRITNDPLREQTLELGAMLVTVDFAEVATDMMSATKFQPLVRATAMYSRTQDPVTMSLMEAAFVDYFIKRMGWVSAFNDFNPNSRKANIGNLILGEDKKLFFAANPQTRNAIISQYCLPALPVFDYVHGQARIPALAALADNTPNGVEKYRQLLQHVFGDTPPQVGNLSQLAMTDWIGAYRDGGNLVDSRNVTYLNTVAQAGAPVQDAQVLMQYTIDNATMVRANLVNQLTPEFQSLYRCDTFVINAQLVEWLLGQISSGKVPMFASETTELRTAPTFLLDQAKQYANINSVLPSVGVRSSGANPFGTQSIFNVLG